MSEIDSGDERWAFHELELLRELYPKHADAKQGSNWNDNDLARNMNNKAKERKWVNPRKYTKPNVRQTINRGALGSGYYLLPAAQASGPPGPNSKWGPVFNKEEKDDKKDDKKDPKNANNKK